MRGTPRTTRVRHRRPSRPRTRTACLPPANGRARGSPTRGEQEAEPVEVDDNFGSTLYAADERDTLPAAAVAASLGCGNPTAVAELREGERVLDLGSGGGIDVVISNCVVNLSVDKPAVFAETFRVLRPGGRIGISDVVAEDALAPEQRAERGDHVGCIAGALSFAEYREGLESAGFEDVEITPTHAVADSMHSAIVRAVKPLSGPRGGTWRTGADGPVRWRFGAGTGTVSWCGCGACRWRTGTASRSGF
ncbi:hypothetical protein ABIE67_004966 [Streptomyces sp. V4I8]|uniref:methyltransferase domain-containing protein n=1 Tax=Streptomyces sp. V4I8 TaxID=3156469 RepID=UPI0035114789